MLSCIFLAFVFLGLALTTGQLTIEDGNSNATSEQTSCTRGAPHVSSREVFTLWENVTALCDTETDDGGWTIIQRRTKGDVDFFKGWNDYKIGFGTPYSDYWLGNDNIHRLTSHGNYALRVDMTFKGKKYYAQYSHFSVGDEVSKYNLSVSGYSGTAGDSLASYHNGMSFSTFDQDNDQDRENCAEICSGAWWYKGCYYSNLNGLWAVNDTVGVIWEEVSSFVESLEATEMKVRK